MNIYAVLTPMLLALIAGEFVYCLYQKNGYYNFQDSIANLATAILNQVVNVATAAAIYSGYAWLYRCGTPVKASAISVAVLFVGIDFLFYWFHRAGHTINVLWAAHSPHHSSEELNYTVGARASVTQRAASFIFYAPLALFYAPELLMPAILVHHVLQFWPHTRAIVKLPDLFEKYFNAQTHHRVHHGVNDSYLDKNYGGVLIIWDKLFGTFEPETETVIYGIRPPLGTWDVVETNFHYYKILWRQAAAAPYWADKILLWFMPLGWKPRGWSPDPGPRWRAEDQVKYQTTLTRETKIYLLCQLPPAIWLMMLVTKHESPLSLPQKIVVGALVSAGMIAWGGILEGKTWARKLEFARVAACLVTIGSILA